MTLEDTLKQLENFSPVHEFKFGHTPLQLEYFQTTNQRGNEKWEYWQHVLQLRSLYTTLSEFKVSKQEIEDEINDANSMWPIWSIKKRKRKLPRLNLKKEQLLRSTREKDLEAKRHLEIIEKKYAHLKELKEEDILKDETSYWTMRLGRQLGASHLSRLLGVSEGDIQAVLSLPVEQQHTIFDGMKHLISASTRLLPEKK